MKKPVEYNIPEPDAGPILYEGKELDLTPIKLTSIQDSAERERLMKIV